MDSRFNEARLLNHRTICCSHWIPDSMRPDYSTTEPFAVETVRKLNLSFSPTFMLGISGSTDEIATISMVFFSASPSSYSVCSLSRASVRGMVSLKPLKWFGAV